jgi:hypothetical protein
MRNENQRVDASSAFVFGSPKMKHADDFFQLGEREAKQKVR